MSACAASAATRAAAGRAEALYYGWREKLLAGDSALAGKEDWSAAKRAAPQDRRARADARPQDLRARDRAKALRGL